MQNNNEMPTIYVYSFLRNEVYDDFVKSLIPGSNGIRFNSYEEFKYVRNNTFYYSFTSRNDNFRKRQMEAGFRSHVVGASDYFLLVHDDSDQFSYKRLVDTFSELKKEIPTELSNLDKVIVVGVTNDVSSIETPSELPGIDDFVKQEGFKGHMFLPLPQLKKQLSEGDAASFLQRIQCVSSSNQKKIKVRLRPENLVEPAKSMRCLESLIQSEKDIKCKQALQDILSKLNNLSIECPTSAYNNLIEWKSGIYKNYLSVLQGKSYYNSIYNMLCTLFAYFNPWKDSAYYHPNIESRGNKNLFWAKAPMQVAEVAVSMVEKSLLAN